MGPGKNYDAAVIGTGVFGAWTAYHLQRAGRRVAMIDAFGPSNGRASSGGESRIIRMGYGKDEIYTHWAVRSLGLWKEFIRQTREDLFHPTGVLWLAKEADPYVTASMNVLAKAGVDAERLTRRDLAERFPQLALEENFWGLYEPGSGVLMARRAVQAVAHETRSLGAEYLQAEVLSPTGAGQLDSVATASGESISAGVFIFACGPWLPNVFPDLLGERIIPTRQEVFYFGAPAGDARFRRPHLPAWLVMGEEVYGLPDLENRGVKIAFDRHGPTIDPDTMDRAPRAESLAAIRTYLGRRFPALCDSPLLESRVCQYENTSNGDFLIDRHPQFANVWLVGGGSGHGFKHGPAVGAYVAERILKGGAGEARFSLATKATVPNRTVF